MVLASSPGPLRVHSWTRLLMVLAKGIKQAIATETIASPPHLQNASDTRHGKLHVARSIQKHIILILVMISSKL